MALVKKSVTTTDQQDEWIKAQLATGGYSTESEIVRELIRREQANSSEHERIRAAIIHGERSGKSNRTAKQVVEAAKDELRADGRL